MCNYDWHNLKEEPDDLPDDEREVLILHCDVYYLGSYDEQAKEWRCDFCTFKTKELTAWKDIRPFRR